MNLKINKKIIEKIIQKLILPSILFLIIVVILELFFPNIINKYFYTIKFVEFCILVVFILDLIFKFLHLKEFKPFIKKYWLDIIIVFPFFLISISFNSILFLFNRIILETFEISDEITNLIKNSEKTGDTFRRINKIWPRIIRILKIIHYKK